MCLFCKFGGFPIGVTLHLNKIQIRGPPRRNQSEGEMSSRISKKQLKRKKRESLKDNQYLAPYSRISAMASLRRAIINAHGILKLSSLPKTEAFLRHPSSHFVSPRPENRWISRFSSSGDISSSDDIDLSNEESKRRLYNRLLYRSKQRGFLELDLVLGKWVEENIHSLDENGIRALLQVLDLQYKLSRTLPLVKIEEEEGLDEFP